MDKQTELMLRYGPKDTVYAANYEDLKAEGLLMMYFMKSYTLGTENNPMVIEFFNQLERKWNDHIGRLEINAKTFEIVDISKTEDVPTIQGLQYCCRQIIFSGLSLWRYHGAGSSTIEPRCYQQRLYGEAGTRADMTGSGGAQGSATRTGQSMRFVGIFSASFPTLTVKESAVFTNSSGYTSGIMLNRQVFSAFPITHSAGVAPFTLATDFNFAPVTTWG